LILAVSVVVILAVVAGIWAAPGLLDWNQHRGSVEALASSLLGRPVRIGGDLSLHLLPQPILTASRLEVDDTGDGVVLTARALRLRVALAPLLAGRIDARELTIEGADLHLPWPPAPGALSQRPPAWLTGVQARAEKSRITIGQVTLSGVDARFETDADTGTLSVAGTGHLAANAVRFTGRLGRPGRDGSAAVEISLDGAEALRDTGGRFTGQLGAAGALEGRMVARGPNLSLLLPMPAVPWRADGRLTAADGLVVADELAVDVNGSAAQGAVTLRVSATPRIDVALAAGRIDLDEWLPVLLHAPETVVPTGLDLSAEAATLGGGIVRRLRGAFDFSPSGITAREITALLPGDATLTMAGGIARPAGPEKAGPEKAGPEKAGPEKAGPEFRGTGHLMAPDLRTTLGWAGKLSAAIGAVGDVLPAGVVRRADVSGRVTVGEGDIALSGLSGTVDGTPLTGSVRATNTGPRPALELVLETDRLMLDPWLPEVPVLTPSVLLARVPGVDVELRLDAHRAEWRGVPIGALRIDGQSTAGRVELRHLGAVVAGVHGVAAGTVEGGRLSDGRLDLDTADLTMLPAVLPVTWQNTAFWQGSGSAVLLVSGPGEALGVKLTAELGDLRLEAQPIFNLAGQSGAGPVTVRHPGAPRLLEVMGLRGTASWLGDGSLSAVAQVSASPDRIGLDSLVLTAGLMRAQGQLSLDAGRAVTGTVSFESLPLPLPDLRAPGSLPLPPLQGWRGDIRLEASEILAGLTPVMQGVSAQLSLQDGRLAVDGVTAQVAGGRVTGQASLATAVDPPVLTVDGQGAGMTVTGPVLDAPPEGIDLQAGTADARIEATATGHSMVALLATLTGHATMTIRDGVAQCVDLVGASAALALNDPAAITAAMQRALRPAPISFTTTDLVFTQSRGGGTLDGDVVAQAGSARIRGNLDLPAGVADLRLTLRPNPPEFEGRPGDPPEIGLRISGPFGTPHRTPELAGLTRWLALRP